MLVLMSGIFFFKQKTAYEMRISDWSSDVCSSDLEGIVHQHRVVALRTCRKQRHRGFDQLLDAADVFDGAGRQLRPGARAARRIRPAFEQIGSASCRERVCQYV